MSYTKQNWNTGDTITADKLNHMEDGIAKEEFVLNAYIDPSTFNPNLSATGPSFSEFNNLVAHNQLDAILQNVENSVYYSTHISAFEDQSFLACFSGFEEYFSISLEPADNGYYAVYIMKSGDVVQEYNYTVTYDSTTKTYTFTLDESGT